MTHRITCNPMPYWFINFITEKRKEDPETLDVDVFNERLKLFHARYIIMDNTGTINPYIEFENEEYYSMFILRWS